jgi:predicted ATPase
MTYMLALLAEVYLDVGKIEEGLATLAEAQAMGNHNGESWWEAELHRLTGECLLARAAIGQEVQDIQSTVLDAELAFQQALTVARHQQAKALQLRIAMSLGRLWQRQDKRDDARRVVAEIYEQFTEGHDTVELTEARELLAALS